MKIAVIGAGVAGISAARELSGAGHAVVVHEKSRGIGGRCSSRRWNGHIVDHGAQYLSASDKEFMAELRTVSGGCIRDIQAPVLDQDGRIVPTNSARLYHEFGNNRIVKDLAGGLDVKLEATISSGLSLLKCAGGEFDAVLSTAPPPQTASLFSVDWKVTYDACATAVFEFQGDFVGRTGEAYGFQDQEGDLAWTACENHKTGRVRTGHTVVVAQMSPEFSRRILHLPKEAYPEILLPHVLRQWRIPPGLLSDSFGHRWSFASPTEPGEPSRLPGGCFVAGDGLSGAGLENARNSGRFAAMRIMQSFQTTL